MARQQRGIPASKLGARHGRLRRSVSWANAAKVLLTAVLVVAVSGVSVAAYAIWGVTKDANIVELAADEVLLPGLVDAHVHVNEPGRTQWEGFATATKAAAAGGVTTLLDMPLNSIPSTVNAAALEFKRLVAGPQAFVDVGFWGGAVPGNGGDLRALHDAPDDLGHAKGDAVDGQSARLQLRHVEQVGDKAVQTLGLFLNGEGEIFADLGVEAVAELPQTGHRGQDRRQGRAQIVGDRR